MADWSEQEDFAIVELLRGCTKSVILGATIISDPLILAEIDATRARGISVLVLADHQSGRKLLREAPCAPGFVVVDLHQVYFLSPRWTGDEYGDQLHMQPVHAEERWEWKRLQDRGLAALSKKH